MKKTDEAVTSPVPKHLWACEKVKRYAEPTREKCVLYFIAYYANPLGYGAFPSYDQLHWDTGLPVRTIRRHIRALVMRGDLMSWCDTGWRGRSNNFFIPCAAETIQELEARTGVGRDQLRLPLVMTDRQPYIVGENGQIIPVNMKYPGPQWPSPRATVALPQGHGGPVTTSNNHGIKNPGALIVVTKKEKKARQQQEQEADTMKRIERSGEISPITRAMIANVIEEMDPGYIQAKLQGATAVDPEALLREERWNALMAESRKELEELGVQLNN